MAQRLRSHALALVLPVLAVLDGTATAAEIQVPAEPGALASAIAAASPGDVLKLAPGRHGGPVTLAMPLTIDGGGMATIDGGGVGSVVTIDAPDVVVRGLAITGSGASHETIDAAVQLTRQAARAKVLDNKMSGNLYGVDVHGAPDALVSGNTIVGGQDRRVNARGNGVYVWNAPGTRVENNDIRYGRDGIFANTSSNNVFRGNRFRDLRFAIHYMYTNDSEISGNLSVGNDLGYALMFSDRITVRGNVSLGDRDHGLMLNYTNGSQITGNLVRGAEKCSFVYNANRNRIADNRFEGCGIGVHFTAGSAGNAITGNAFVGNRTQVKYVGSRWLTWSADGRGNFWSDYTAIDLNGDGIAEAPYRPNDLVDRLLWTQPLARLLTASPAMQLLRWTQSQFPALLPGGIVDTAPLMRPVVIDIPFAGESQ
jgi:nitrous oxidase accessory protein